MEPKDVPEWAALGFRRDFRRSIDREFAIAIAKHVADNVKIDYAFQHETRHGVVHIDFTFMHGSRKVVVNIEDDSPPLKDRRFPAVALVFSGKVDAVYTLRARATAYTLDDAVYLLSLSEPSLFSKRSLHVLKTASRIGRSDTEIRKTDDGVEARLYPDEWDPPNLPDYVFVWRVTAKDATWGEYANFLLTHPLTSFDDIATEWARAQVRALGAR